MLTVLSQARGAWQTADAEKWWPMRISTGNNPLQALAGIKAGRRIIHRQDL
jgi:hypothetical protein